MLAPLSSHTTARKPVGKQFDRKPTQQGSRHLESPPTGNLERYDNRRNVITHHESGTYVLGHPLKKMRWPLRVFRISYLVPVGPGHAGSNAFGAVEH